MAAWRVWLVGSLMAVLLVSAMAVIYSKYQSRLLFIEIQKQEKILEQSEVEWGQLQLELMYHTEQNQIERNAVDKLKLVMPPRENIIYVKPK
jgi:cell division protein FtsL